LRFGRREDGDLEKSTPAVVLRKSKPNFRFSALPAGNDYPLSASIGRSPVQDADLLPERAASDRQDAGMSLDATADARADAPYVADESFVKEAGRILFYPFGPGWQGYIVPDDERERALRAALRRYRDNPIWWRTWPLFLLPVAFCVFLAVSGHPFLLLTAFVLPIVLTLICDRILLRYQFRALLRGLKTVGSRDKAPGYIRQILAAAVALAWITLAIYDRRVAALPVAEGTTAYYTDIAQPLMVALVCGFLALATMSVRYKLEAQFSANKILLALVLFTSFAVFGTGLAALDFFYPVPELILTPNELLCNRHVRWADVTDLGQASGVQGRQYAWFQVDLKRPGENSGDARCEISGLNEDYQTVYRAIRTAWLATRRPSPVASTGDAAIDQIAIGATRIPAP
jgi:hypothetical protein